MRFTFAFVAFFVASSIVLAGDGNRLSYLDSNEVWYPHKDFPKLITPQWVGEDGVECVVTLAIDDMRDTAKYEAYLRPILQRLKQIDGRAPVSIMTNSVKPDDPQFQAWLQEGLSLECHTADHPCPILAGGDIKKSKATYDKCIDLMASIPNNKPVAFRTPCCDSLNTVSPRLFSEIINKTTPGGNFLQLDSSVFTLYTADDPSIPRELLTDPDGREKFRKYIPRKLARGNVVHDGFVNTIENYPYPYVIQRLCWEFPCMVPSDWSANHLHQSNNPDTVRDLKAALDITVLKQGVFNLVFHPHGWIKPEQVIELIDHAVAKHGKKVKFLTFKECVERLNKNLLAGRSLRNAEGAFNNIVVAGEDASRGMRVLKDGDAVVWTVNQEVRRGWMEEDLPSVARSRGNAVRLIDINGDGHDDVVFSNHERFGAWLFESIEKGWSIELLNVKRGEKQADLELPPIVREDGSDNGFFVRDRNLCWINEDTDGLPDFVLRVAFDTLLGDRLPDAKSPEAAKQSMRVTPGYRVDLVAHEPLTMDPVALDFGPDGKLWVAEMADYPRGLDDKGQPGGRIRFLEDTNGDGVYDKSTLILDGVPFPNGVIAWRNGVLVSAAPDIFYAEDTDGDGKADKREVLFTGFAEGNQQHRANGFSRGLDNWLYLANGDSGGVVKSIKTGATVDIRGRDIRIRPDTGEIEAVSGQSQFGRNRDDWGNWFGNNNSRPMWHYVLDDHYLKRNPNLVPPNLQKDVSITPGAAPVFPSSKTLTRFNDFHTANRFTSACSAMVNRDSLLEGVGKREGEAPAEPQRVATPTSKSARQEPRPPTTSVFISEPVHNLVHREIMTADGFSFTSRRDVNEAESEFLSSTDNWFRPTQLKTGPDGALYVADMYRLVIEHPQWIPIEWQKKLDLRAGHDKGRIWRVAPVGMERRKNSPPPRRGFSDPEPPRKPRPIPLHGGMPILSVLDTDELVAALDSPNGWQRDVAQQLLIDQFNSLAIPLLRDQGKTSKNPLCRLHSLCTLEGFLTSEKAPKDNSANLLSSPAWAQEQCYRRAMDALIEILPTSLADPHPGIRRHAIRICEWFGAPKSRPLVGSVMVAKFHESILDILTKLVDDPDPQVRLQLAHSLGEIKHPQAGTLLGRLALKSNGNVYFTASILSSLHSENLEATLAEVMKHGFDQHGADQTDLLQQLLGQATAFNHEASLVALLNRATEPKSGGGFERWQYSAVEQFLVALDRRFTTLDKWLKGLSAEARPVAGRLQTLFASARILAASDSAAPEDRIAAVRVLGRSADAKDEIGLLGELITPRHPPELQSAALATLARSKSGEIAKTLLANYRSFAPSLRTQSSDILLSRDAWRDELLAALEAKRLSPSDLDAATRQRLLDHKTKAVAERAAKILAVDLNSDRAKVVAEYLPTVRAGGDEQLGSQLFKKMCSQCHKLGDVGHAVGPDLMSLTDKSPDAMITAVLDPNRAVEAKFLTFTAITKAGVAHTGLMAAETATSLTLRAAEGKEVNLLRNEIDELQSNAKSLMPEGLERDLKPADAAALVAYIRRNVPLPAMKKFPGNEPRVVTPATDGKFTLTPFEAEIYGPTIVIEEKHKNLGWWSSADDIVVWTINVPKAGTYSVSWTYACEPSASGNRVVIEAEGKSLAHRVEKTSGWDDYQSQELGNLELPAGEVRLTMKPASRPLPALVDLREVKLVRTE